MRHIALLSGSQYDRVTGELGYSPPLPPPCPAGCLVSVGRVSVHRCIQGAPCICFAQHCRFQSWAVREISFRPASMKPFQGFLFCSFCRFAVKLQKCFWKKWKKFTWLTLIFISREETTRSSIRFCGVLSVTSYWLEVQSYNEVMWFLKMCVWAVWSFLCQIALLDSPTALSMEEKLHQNEARVSLVLFKLISYWKHSENKSKLVIYCNLKV